MDPLLSSGEIVWRPTPELIAGSNLKRFMDAHGLASLEDLQRRSVTDIAWFWDAILKTLGIRLDQPYARVVDLSRGPAWAQWCIGGKMNIVRSCLDKYAATPADGRLALRWEGEE